MIIIDQIVTFLFLAFLIVIILIELFISKIFHSLISLDILPTFCFYFNIISFILINFFNPGIIDKEIFHKNEHTQQIIDLKNNNVCEKCNIIVPKKLKFQHCDNCGICIKEINHHSFILNKCIGKYTIYFYFYFMFCSFFCAITIYFNIDILIKFFQIRIYLILKYLK